MILRPQKAPSESITDEQLQIVLNIHGYVLGSPKLDGYRCTTEDGAFTSSMKKVTNLFIQRVLSDPMYNGLDGELIVGKPNLPETFNNTTGPVRRADGEPDFKFYVFDRHDMPKEAYKVKHAGNVEFLSETPFVHVVKQKRLETVEAVRVFELKCVDGGYEGAMIRVDTKLYKEGRCTLKEQNIFKRKPTEDDEAIIIGFDEQMLNTNKAKKNELGNMVRSSHKSGKVGKGTLGSFHCESPLWPGVVFKVGTGKGLTNALRKKIWDKRDMYIGDTLTYKYQKYGSIDAPRQPIFKGFRHEDDLTTY